MILDIVIPIYNNEKQIINLYNKITEDLKNIKHNLIFVDDNSSDKSLQILKELYKNDESNIKIVSLSKTQGKDTCIYTGIDYSKHNLVCIYDMDIQANTSHIVKMYTFLKEHPEYDEVCMCASNNKQSKKINMLNKIFYLNYDPNKTYYRMFRRNVVKSIKNAINNNIFTKYTFDIIGFNVYYLNFESKNIPNDLSIKDLLLYSKKPFNYLKYINFLLFIIAFIITLLCIFKKINISNNVLLLVIIILSIMFLSIIHTTYNYLLYKNRRTIPLIKELIGFDDNVL